MPEPEPDPARGGGGAAADIPLFGGADDLPKPLPPRIPPPLRLGILFIIRLSKMRRFSSLMPRPSNFSWLKAKTQRFIGRNALYRILTVTSFGFISFSFYKIMSRWKTDSNNPQFNYIQPSEILEFGIQDSIQHYYLVGIVKPDSIKVKKGTKDHEFVITDFIHDIKIHFQGELPPVLMEGETCRCKGEFVDEYNPTDFIAYKLEGQHEAELPKTVYQPRSRDIKLRSNLG